MSVFAVKIISLRQKNLAQAILNTTSVLRFSNYLVVLEVIFLRMFFIIGRRIKFILGNNDLLPLIIQVKQESSYTLMKKSWSIW